MSVIVTGLGIAAPTGLGLADYWAATLAGKSGIGPVRRFDASGYPCSLAGEVPGFDPAEHLPSRLLPQTDHMTRLALVAADEAIADAGVVPAELPEYGMGVVTASSSGGFEFGQRELSNLWRKGGEYVSAYQSFAWFYAVNSGQLSIRHGLRGPGGVLVSDQAGGLDAVAHARRHVRRGTGVVVTGGMDGSVCPWGWVAQLAGGRLSTATAPERAYLPFDAAASGYVPGEGGAILVLEDADAAARRGVTGYGEIAGYAATFDPPPIARPAGVMVRQAGTTAAAVPAASPAGAVSTVRPASMAADPAVLTAGPAGAVKPANMTTSPAVPAASSGVGSSNESGLRVAIELALADAGVEPAEVDAVFADAAAVPDLDRVEAEAIAAVFSPRGVAVTAPKTMTGRLYSGGAPLDLAAALLSIRDGVLPPTVHTEPAEEYRLDLVTAPREARVRIVLVLARGHGGFNSAMVVRATAERERR